MEDKMNNKKEDSNPNETNSFITIVDIMKNVQLDTAEATLNKDSISDGNGGRILL